VSAYLGSCGDNSITGGAEIGFLPPGDLGRPADTIVRVAESCSRRDRKDPYQCCKFNTMMLRFLFAARFINFFIIFIIFIIIILLLFLLFLLFIIFIIFFNIFLFIILGSNYS
jgi:hypothetical protein